MEYYQNATKKRFLRGLYYYYSWQIRHSAINAVKSDGCTGTGRGCCLSSARRTTDRATTERYETNEELQNSYPSIHKEDDDATFSCIGSHQAVSAAAD